MNNQKTSPRICRKHASSSYLIERVFAGNRSADEIITALVKVHSV